MFLKKKIEPTQAVVDIYEELTNNLSFTKPSVRRYRNGNYTISVLLQGVDTVVGKNCNFCIEVLYNSKNSRMTYTVKENKTTIMAQEVVKTDIPTTIKFIAEHLKGFIEIRNLEGFKLIKNNVGQKNSVFTFGQLLNFLENNSRYGYEIYENKLFVHDITIEKVISKDITIDTSQFTLMVKVDGHKDIVCSSFEELESTMKKKLNIA